MIGIIILLTLPNFIYGYQIKVWNAGGCLLQYKFRMNGNETAWYTLVSGQTTTSDKFYRLDESVVAYVAAVACGETHCFTPNKNKPVRDPEAVFTLKGEGFWLFETYEYWPKDNMLVEMPCPTNAKCANTKTTS